MPVNTGVYAFPWIHAFISLKYLHMEKLDYMVCGCSAFQETENLLCKVVAPLHIPTWSIWGFRLLFTILFLKFTSYVNMLETVSSSYVFEYWRFPCWHFICGLMPLECNHSWDNWTWKCIFTTNTKLVFASALVWCQSWDVSLRAPGGTPGIRGPHRKGGNKRWRETAG